MLKRLISKLPSYTITVGGKPYLTRYYLFLKDRKFGNIYFHHFHSSDQGDELHSHPFLFGLSFVFSGGYSEESKNKDGSVSRKLFKAPTFNFITNKNFHRVDLLDELSGAWSIFVAGPRTKDWYFWDRHTNETKHWSENPEAIP